MAFLSHSIPWHSLASMFEYAERCDPGPQHPDLFAKSKAGQRKQVEYFAQKFQTIIREHSADERKKYRPTKDYADRAETWTVSQIAKLDVKNVCSTEDFSTEEQMQHISQQDRNLELQSSSKKIDSTPAPERRFVYPSDFATTYMSYVSITSGSYTGREGLVEDFRNVETWIDFAARDARYTANSGTRAEHDRLWLDQKSCSDILRLLIIDAATTEDATRKTYGLETMFLLTCHPQVSISRFIHDGMSCCNKNVGLTSLVKTVAASFVYLNILWALVDGNPSSPLLQPREHLQEYGSSYCRNSTLRTLIPRPAYMNTKSFNNMLLMVLEEHGHMVEHVFFNPLLAPYDNGRRSKYLRSHRAGSETSGVDMRRERDVFTDLPMLKEALKGMWKILVYCDMLFQEIGKPINWDWVVIDSISSLFQDKGGFERLMGLGWLDYTLDREQDEKYGFFATGQDSDRVC